MPRRMPGPPPSPRTGTRRRDAAGSPPPSRDRRGHRDGECYFGAGGVGAGVAGAGVAGAGLPKSTVGGTEIAFSLSTVKFGFTSILNSMAVRLVGNERTVTLKS